MKRITHITIFILAILATMTVSMRAVATPPFGPTGIVKRDGTWRSTSQITSTLIIVDRDADRRFTLSLSDIFPTKELYDQNVDFTSAGPLCGSRSLSFVTKLEGVDYYFMRCVSGTPVLINLDTGKPGWIERLADPIREEEKRRIVEIIEQGILFYKSKGKEGTSSGGMLRAAMEMAARYRMTETRELLEAIKKHNDWGGDFQFLSNQNFINGLKRYDFKVLKYRSIAQESLRRLGFPILGYPSRRFEEGQDMTKVLPPEIRIENLSKIEIGTTSHKVLRLLSSPEMMMHAYGEGSSAESKVEWTCGWRYDFFDGDFSIVFLWDEKGRVEQALKITPGLWRGNEFFSKGSEKQLFGHSGSINGIHFYSDDFPGKVEIVRPRATTDKS